MTDREIASLVSKKIEQARLEAHNAAIEAAVNLCSYEDHHQRNMLKNRLISDEQRQSYVKGTAERLKGQILSLKKGQSQ